MAACDFFSPSNITVAVFATKAGLAYCKLPPYGHSHIMPAASIKGKRLRLLLALPCQIVERRFPRSSQEECGSPSTSHVVSNAESLRVGVVVNLIVPTPQPREPASLKPSKWCKAESRASSQAAPAKRVTECLSAWIDIREVNVLT